MKRKRGAKGGFKKEKKNKPSVVNDPIIAPVSVTEEENLGLEEPDDGQVGNEMHTEQPAIEVEAPKNMSKEHANQPGEMSTGKGHARVKVKLKSSKSLARHQSSDAQTPSDTDKSNTQVASDRLELTVHKEDGCHSDGQTSQMQSIPPKKASSIKIKTSRGLGLSNESVHGRELDKVNDPPKMLSERVSDNERTADSSLPNKSRKDKKDRKKTHSDPRYNEKELIAALEVIRKVMKMEAAGPFNVPVDPVALGIPDYFDIIDTPMDFGTICHNLEHSNKYMNSEDVFKDVQYIWDNCYKYNNKGDYIVDLMKRVKKNFVKYWTAAGLYAEVPTTGAAENNQIEDVSQSGQEKVHPRPKSKHRRRRYGIEHHKSDCLCAVCVVRRRRKEREEDIVVIDNQPEINDANVPRQCNQEESSPIDNVSSQNASSSLDRSLDTGADADVEEAEDEERTGTPEESGHAQPVKLESMDDELGLQPHVRGTLETSQQPPVENGTKHSDHQPQGQEIDETQADKENDDTSIQEEEATPVDHHPQAEETTEAQLTKRSQQVEAHEDLVLEENHSVLQICRSLFPPDLKSAWNGPHSLFRRHVSMQEGPIHAAVTEFLKH